MSNSTLRVDIGNPNASQIIGFNPSVKSKPFQSNSSNTDVFVQAGLKHRLPVGFDFKLLEALDFPIDIDSLEFGPFLSLPQL